MTGEHRAGGLRWRQSWALSAVGEMHTSDEKCGDNGCSPVLVIPLGTSAPEGAMRWLLHQLELRFKGATDRPTPTELSGLLTHLAQRVSVEPLQRTCSCGVEVRFPNPSCERHSEVQAEAIRDQIEAART